MTLVPESTVAPTRRSLPARPLRKARDPRSDRFSSIPAIRIRSAKP
jgi:hypothetical protein